MSLKKRMESLEAVVRGLVDAPLEVRMVAIEAGSELPTEAEGEMVICRVIVTPPERPEEEPLPETLESYSPRIERGERTPFVIDRGNFHRPIDWPDVGVA